MTRIMEIMRLHPLSTAVAAAVLSSVAFGQGVVQVGDTPNYNFGSKTFNGQGVQGSADLLGKPVLVDFWGVH